MTNTLPPVDIIFDETKIPKKPSSAWFDVAYRSNGSGVIAINDGEIIFSDPSVADKNLFSRGYNNYIGIAGITGETKRLLAHICPGRYYPTSKQKFSTVALREYKKQIEQALARWADECGATNENVGLFGSCIFPSQQSHGSEAYIDTVRLMSDIMGKALEGEPQIIGLPSKGVGDQHAAVSNDKVTIMRQPGFLKTSIPKTHIKASDIGQVIGLMMNR